MRTLFFIIILILPVSIYSQSALEKGLYSINKPDAEKYIGILASDSLEGRKAGAAGGLMASEYLKNIFQEAGIVSWFDTYFQSFEYEYRKSVKMRNVLGCIRGRHADEVVIIGAHYDHLGIKKNSPNDSIYNGADDNASGVSAVLQIAKAFKESGEQPLRTVIFALWDGEEMGLLGSSFFVKDYYNSVPVFPLMSAPVIKGYINCDMIGRNKSESDATHVVSYFSPERPEFGEWLKDDIEKYGLNLAPEFRSMDKVPGGSDHMPFQQKGVPVIFYNTDLHPDYHKLTDHADRINYDKVVDITKAAYLNLWNMANLKNF
ncbi:MAG: M20/M25/M40 family metallo-hydrolase [Prevotella sp.]|jgi:Zn-dependent M28 family amino/carboxypeptidase|nr:M20/M25/M40 family metallo-hydrolase [Prevotella sp.]